MLLVLTGQSAKTVARTSVGIHVTDLDRAKDFYGDKLGFRLIGESPENSSLALYLKDPNGMVSDIIEKSE